MLTTTQKRLTEELILTIIKFEKQSEFLRLIEEICSHPQFQIIPIFNKLDTDLKGYIDELDIYKFCRTYKIIMEVQDTKMIVKLLDLDHDGYIGINDLQKNLTSRRQLQRQGKFLGDRSIYLPQIIEKSLCFYFDNLLLYCRKMEQIIKFEMSLNLLNIRKVFIEIDRKNQGFINEEILLKFIEISKMNIPLTDATYFILHFDKDSTFKLTYSQFKYVTDIFSTQENYISYPNSPKKIPTNKISDLIKRTSRIQSATDKRPNLKIQVSNDPFKVDVYMMRTPQEKNFRESSLLKNLLQKNSPKVSQFQPEVRTGNILIQDQSKTSVNQDCRNTYNNWKNTFQPETSINSSYQMDALRRSLQNMQNTSNNSQSGIIVNKATPKNGEKIKFIQQLSPRRDQLTPSADLNNVISEISKKRGSVALFRYLLRMTIQLREIEEAKLSLCLCKDFNLMDSYRVFDRSGTGTVDDKRFLDILESKKFLLIFKEIQIVSSLIQVRLMMKQYCTESRNFLRYSDYVEMIVPSKEEFSQILSNRNPNYKYYTSLTDLFSITTLKCFKELLQVILQAESLFEEIKLSLKNPISELFSYLDRGAKGHIDLSDISQFMEQNGVKLSPQESRRIMKRFTKKDNEVINFSCFDEQLKIYK